MAKFPEVLSRYVPAVVKESTIPGKAKDPDVFLRFVVDSLQPCDCDEHDYYIPVYYIPCGSIRFPAGLYDHTIFPEVHGWLFEVVKKNPKGEIVLRLRSLSI